MDDSPASLVLAAASGDADAYSALVERFGGLVWAVARAHRLGAADAADVSQTTWLRLVENLGRIREPERVGAWLATTARRESLAVLRRQGRTIPTELPDDAPGGDGPSEPAPEAALLDRERDQALWAAFATLPPRCQALLRLLFVSDPAPSYDEVGAALGMSVGSIGPTRGRCLERLRSHPQILRISDGPASSAP